MNEPSDQHLLSVWAERRDEAAFRSLLGRYAGFVYGSALRRVGDADLAQEISQDVFARLSHHAARLTTHPSLAGWLHRATMLLALDRLRRRARHERKLRKLSAMNQTPATEPDPWADARPHLDAALDHLASQDRDVLMLRFAERLTFAEIGVRLGGTADSVRMRANRALATLSELLRKQGVVIPVAVLSSGLTGTLAQAAPAALAALTPAMLAGTGKASALSTIIHAMQTTKISKTVATTALALLLPLPLILQQQQISAAEQRISLLQMAKPNVTALPLVATASLLGAANPPEPGINFKRLGEDALLGDYFGGRRIQDAIAGLETPNLVGLIETILGGSMLPEPRGKLLEELLVELRKRDLALYVDWSFKVLPATVPNAAVGEEFGRKKRGQIIQAFRDWAARDAVQAAAWAAKNRKPWRQLHGSPLDRILEVSAFAGLVIREPGRAGEQARTLSTQTCREALMAALATVESAKVPKLIEWAASIQDREKRRDLLAASLLFRAPKNGLLEKVRPAIERLPLDDDDRGWLATRMVSTTTAASTGDLPALRAEAFPWLEKILAPELASYAKGALLGQTHETQKAYDFISRELERSPDDDLIAGYVNAPNIWVVEGFQPHAEIGFRLATQVHDAERRAALLAKAWTDLRNQSAQAARAILQIPELGADDRSELEALAIPSEKGPR